MGLQNQLNDVASDSIPILVLSLIATAVTHLRSLLSSLCHSLTHRHHHHHPLGSGLATLIAVSEHLKHNSSASFRYRTTENVETPSCVFCLSALRYGDRVRRLDCRHVFHKDCLDGWIDQMRFNCPLCRSPLFPPLRVDHTRTQPADLSVR